MYVVPDTYFGVSAKICAAHKFPNTIGPLTISSTYFYIQFASTMDEVMHKRPDEEDVSTQTSKRNAANCTIHTDPLLWCGKDHEQVERNGREVKWLMIYFSVPAISFSAECERILSNAGK